MAVGGGGLDYSQDVETPGHAAEGSEALAVGIALPAKVELGLGADAEEEIRRGGVGTGTCHRDRAIEMLHAGDARSLERDGRPILLGEVRIHAALDDLDLHRVVGLVVGVQGDRAVKLSAGVAARIHVLQEVGDGGGSILRIKLRLNDAQLGVNADVRFGRG